MRYARSNDPEASGSASEERWPGEGAEDTSAPDIRAEGCWGVAGETLAQGPDQGMEEPGVG